MSEFLHETPVTFSIGTKVVMGIGSLAALPSEIVRLNGTRAAIVADRGVAASGLLDDIVHGVDPSTISVRLLIDPDPDAATAENAARAARASNCDLVIAVGGGSALGAAKAVAIRLTNWQDIAYFEGLDEAPNEPAPTIAIPTTAGSGSEVSKVLVLHEAGRDAEMVIRLEGEQPRVAILDGTVLRKLPRRPMLYAGLDALSHCLESLWAQRSTMFTAGLAKEAAMGLLNHLPGAIAGVANGSNAYGDNDATLQALLEASAAANMACGNSGLALVHALSAAPSVHLPHGLQNGILLPHVARFNEAVADTDACEIAAGLPDLYENVSFDPSFPAGTAGTGLVKAMVKASANHPFRRNNRRPSSDDDLLELLKSIPVQSGAGRFDG